jgi:hypothetical protein
MAIKPKPISREEVLEAAGVEAAVLGRTYKDKISGFVGIATARTRFLYACVQVALHPPGTKKEDGGPAEGFYVNETLLEETTSSLPIIPYVEEEDVIVLGDTYKDSITEFEGVAVSITKFLTSSQRVGLQSSKLHEGKVVDVQYFDAHQLNEAKAKVKPKVKTAKEPGGPGECARPLKCASGR